MSADGVGLRPPVPVAAGRETLAWRIFRLERGEAGRVLAFALLGALLQAGVAVGLTSADALFLTKVGVARLPVIYILTPLVMGTYVPLHAYAISRLGVARVLNGTLMLVAVSAVVMFLALRWAPDDQLLYYGVKLYAVLWYIGLYSLFWNFVDGFFDIQDAKRLYAFLSGGGSVGAIAGAGLTAFLVQTRPVMDLFVLWAALSLLCLPVARFIMTRWEPLEADFDADEQVSGLREQMKRTGAAMRGSPFVLVLGVVLVVGLLSTTVAEYQYLDILSSGVDEEELATLLGSLLAVVSVFNFAVNIFLFNRLVVAIGVRNVALIQTLTFMGVFTLLLLQGGMLAAVAGFFAYHGITASIEYNNQNLLFNAVPEDTRPEVRTILEGLAEPLATALGGFFLFFAASRMTPAQLSTTGLSITLVGFVLVLVLRSRYGDALAAILKRRWLDLTRPADELLSNIEPDAVQSLVRYSTHPDPRMSQSALRILWLNDRHEAIRLTLDFLRTRKAEERTALIPHLRRVLDDADPEVVRPLIEWILGHLDDLGPAFLDEMGARGLVPTSQAAHRLRSRDPDEAAAAVTVMWQSGRPEDRMRALEALLDLLHADEPAVRAAGVRALGRLRHDLLGRHAVTCFDDADAAVRHAATEAVQAVASPETPELVRPVLRMLESGTERQLFLGLDTLARIEDPMVIPTMLTMADRFPPPVRRVAIRVIERIGLKSVPQAVAELKDAACPYQGRVIAARALSRIALPQLDALAPRIIVREIDRGEWFLAAAHALRDADGIGAGVLRRFYRDMLSMVTDFALELLSVVGRIPDFEMLRMSLRKGFARARANALESIEQGVERDIFQRLRPLLLVHTGSWPARHLQERDVYRSALESPFPLERAAAACAIHESGAADAQDALLALLADRPTPMVGDTVLALLGLGGKQSAHPIERVAHLMRTPAFEEVPLPEVAMLADDGVTRPVEPGALIPAPGSDTAVAVLLAGGARTPAGEALETGYALELWKTADASGRPIRSSGCVVFELSREALAAAAHRSSAVALALLARQEAPQ